MEQKQALQAVDERLATIMDTDVDVLRDASKHILEAGGKRVRPRLTLLAYEAAGGATLEDAVPVAAAVELVHTATLVHDDINDHGTLRRGRPTVNALWGRTFALLTGDYLFTKVYELMSPYKDLNIVFAEATVALVEGETLQAAAAKSGKLDRETYMKVITKKTAALFAAACKLGALMAHATPMQVTALEQYGYNVGLAFQIVDDILDLIADSNQLGKTAGLDVHQGKGLAMAIGGSGAHGGSGSNGHKGQVALLELMEPAVSPDPMIAFKQRLMTGTYIQEGHAMAAQLAAMASAALGIFPDSPALEAMRHLTREVVERDR
ncbi:MAG TPA: polyprenyl synthetase family protein [Aggregatilineales bacterium]|nr:polyprenyl synthetase family protein [Aggregatilineales bacterium]